MIILNRGISEFFQWANQKAISLNIKSIIRPFTILQDLFDKELEIMRKSLKENQKWNEMEKLIQENKNNQEELDKINIQYKETIDIANANNKIYEDWLAEQMPSDLIDRIQSSKISVDVLPDSLLPRIYDMISLIIKEED
jgi:hypothetical protein